MGPAAFNGGAGAAVTLELIGQCVYGVGAALLMTPRSTYTSSDMRQNSDSRRGGVNHPG